MRTPPPRELEERISRFVSLLDSRDVDLALILSPTNLSYFTGSIQSGLLCITRTHHPLYLVERHYPRARMESPLKDLLPLHSREDIPSILTAAGIARPRKIGLELQRIPAALRDQIASLFAGADLEDVSDPIDETRMIKSSYEIHAMMDAAHQLGKLFAHVPGVAREGMTDLELCAELERVIRLDGHPGFVRHRRFQGDPSPVVVLSGPDGAVPAHADLLPGGMGLSPSHGRGSGWERIERGAPIIVSAIASVDGYHVSQTRTFVLGPPEDGIERLHDASLRIQAELERRAPLSPSGEELHRAALQTAAELALGDFFLGPPGSHAPAVGRGLGLESDELPVLGEGETRRILPATAWSTEPLFMVPGLGAVGVGNSYYLALDGSLKRLTSSDDTLVIL